MKTIKQDELFQGLSGFLQAKGIELKDGVYPQHIRRACNLLGDTINSTQKTARKAKFEVDRKMDQLRQSIHEATAPKAAAGSAPNRASAKAPKAGKSRSNPKRPSTQAKAHKK